MTAPGEPLSADGRAAAEAMLTILSHQRVAAKVNEALFEALLAYVLNSVPSLSAGLFGITASNFALGKRYEQPDVVGYRDQEIVVGVEIKIHSNLQFPANGKCQLDNYAKTVPAARLFLVTADRRANRLRSEMKSEKKWTESCDRWEILTLSRLQQTLLHLEGPELPVTENPAARLILALARLTGSPVKSI